MNKRGQFYILIVIILCIAIFAIVSKSNTIQEGIVREDFTKLAENYAVESPKVVNYAIYKNEPVLSKLNIFTTKFIEYARKVNPTVGLLYVYSNSSDAYITNFLNESTTSGGEIPIPGYSQIEIERVNLNISGKEFIHQVPVEIGFFGDAWATGEFNPGDEIILKIGSIFYNFNTTRKSDNVPKLQLVIQSGDELKQVYTTGDENIPFNPVF